VVGIRLVEHAIIAVRLVEHAVRLVEHAVRLVEHAVRLVEHAVRLVEHAVIAVRVEYLPGLFVTVQSALPGSLRSTWLIALRLAPLWTPTRQLQIK
jgi:hypothetical protein